MLAFEGCSLSCDVCVVLVESITCSLEVFSGCSAAWADGENVTAEQGMIVLYNFDMDSG